MNNEQQQTLDNLIGGHAHLTRRITDEEQARKISEERIEKEIKQTAKNMEALKADVKKGFEIINDALNRLDAPPDKEQSPVLAQIQENIDELFQRLGYIERSLRQLQGR